MQIVANALHAFSDASPLKSIDPKKHRFALKKKKSPCPFPKTQWLKKKKSIDVFHRKPCYMDFSAFLQKKHQ